MKDYFLSFKYSLAAYTFFKNNKIQNFSSIKKKKVNGLISKSSVNSNHMLAYSHVNTCVW